MSPSVKTRACKRCGHNWLPRQPGKPRRCPNRHCHSVRWDEEPIGKEPTCQPMISVKST